MLLSCHFMLFSLSQPLPGSRALSLGRSTSIGTSVCCFPGSPWRWTAVLPTSSSPSQSPLLTRRTLPAAEAWSPPSSTRQATTETLVTTWCQRQTQTVSPFEKRRGLRTRVKSLSWSVSTNLCFIPCHPKLAKGAASWDPRRLIRNKSLFSVKLTALEHRGWVKSFGFRMYFWCCTPGQYVFNRFHG